MNKSLTKLNEQLIEKLEYLLPLSLNVLSLYASGKYKEIFYGKTTGNLAILNFFREWHLYASNRSDLINLLKKIKRLDKLYRIVIYCNFILDDILEGENYHSEEFMIKLNTQIDLVPYNFAQEDHASVLANLNQRYCLDEVNWEYYHQSTADQCDQYRKNIKNKEVFIVGEPPISKVEILAKCGKFVKFGKVYTDKFYRRQGFADTCLKGFLSWCSEKNLTPILNVRIDNIAAKRLYVRNNFRVMGKIVYMVIEGK